MYWPRLRLFSPSLVPIAEAGVLKTARIARTRDPRLATTARAHGFGSAQNAMAMEGPYANIAWRGGVPLYGTHAQIAMEEVR